MILNIRIPIKKIVRLQDLERFCFQLLVIPFLLPNGVIAYLDFDRSLMIIRISCCLLIILFLVFKNRLLSIKINSILLWEVLFVLSLIISTIFNNVDFYPLFHEIVLLISIFLWCYGGFRLYGIKLLNFIVKYQLFVTLANLLTVLLLRNGIFIDEYGNSQYVISTDNHFASFLLPSLALSLFLLDCKKEKKRWKYILYCLVYLAAIFIRWSGTAVAVSIYFIALLILYGNKWFKKIFNYKVLVFFTVFLCYYFAIVQKVFFSEFIVGFLNKTITFTGRTYIWSQVIETISHEPILGYGYLSYVYKSFKMEDCSTLFVGPHNTYFQIVLYGGIVLLIGYFGILLSIKVKYKLKTIRAKNIDKLQLGINAILLYSIFEADFLPVMFVIILFTAQFRKYII